MIYLSQSIRKAQAPSKDNINNNHEEEKSLSLPTPSPSSENQKQILTKKNMHGTYGANNNVRLAASRDPRRR